MAQIAEPVWIEAELALAIHDRQLAEHGGPIGVRDASAMESALGRPRNQWAYGEADLCALAGLCLWRGAQSSLRRRQQAHRMGAGAPIPALNNVRISFAPEEAIRMVIALASGTLTEVEVGEWFRARLA
jgi:death-on-curing protein